MTIFSKKFGGNGPFAPPGYVYMRSPFEASELQVHCEMDCIAE